jgi:hypothetical protein
MDARQATITLAMLMARDAVKLKLRAEGRVKLSQVSAAELSRLARAYLLAHRDELFAQAEASPIVQNLKNKHSGGPLIRQRIRCAKLTFKMEGRSNDHWLRSGQH